jgi:heme-degrading monooxygenase HmoA
MIRRQAFRSLLARLSAFGIAGAAAPLASAATPAIQLHTDLEVKAGSEAQLLSDFEKLFLPRIRKAPGFVDAKLLKFRKANIGQAPDRYNYRLVQTFTSEELREKWTVHEDHKIAWHTAIEKHVKTPFIAFLYDVRP